MMQYFNAEIERMSYLRPAGSEHLLLPFAEIKKRLDINKTFYSTFNTGFSWKDYSRSVNWFETIWEKVGKYGLIYSRDAWHQDQQTPGEKFEGVLKRQNEVKDLLLKEMGVDFYGFSAYKLLGPHCAALAAVSTTLAKRGWSFSSSRRKRYGSFFSATASSSTNVSTKNALYELPTLRQ